VTNGAVTDTFDIHLRVIVGDVEVDKSLSILRPVGVDPWNTAENLPCVKIDNCLQSTWWFAASSWLLRRRRLTQFRREDTRA